MILLRVLRHSCACAALLLLTFALHAQDDATVLAPHKPIPKKVASVQFPNEEPIQRALVGGPWLLDPNMKSTIYLRNNHETASLAVTPVLYLSNGHEIALSTITLAGGATTSVSIGDELLQLGIAPYTDLRGFVQLDYKSAFDLLCATVVSVDTVHSVVFTYGFRPTSPAAATMKAIGRAMPDPTTPSAQRIDGVWWKRTPSVVGFITLSNTTDQITTAQLTVTGADGSVLEVHPVSLAPRNTQTLSLKELGSSIVTAGGLQLTYTAPHDAVLINGGLEDLSTGYSATMNFRPYMTPPSTTPSAPTTTTWSELGLMTGIQDPMMLFPQGTTFTPFSVLHNVSASAVTVTPEFFWMANGAAQRHSAPAINIPPSQTVVLDMTSLLNHAGLASYNGMFNLTFQTPGDSHSLLSTGGSVDNTGTYVFQIRPHEVANSIGKTISYWDTANGDDTMVAIWNPADEAQDFKFTIAYTGGTYVIPIHLEARATSSFTLAALIKNQVPDPDGNVIPLAVTDGSAKLSGANAENETILVDMDAGSYNIQKATCSYYCISCGGYVNILVDPLTLQVFSNAPSQSFLEGYTGATYSVSGGTWSSSNTSVATMSSTYAGMVSGIAHGSYTASASFADIPLYTSAYCAYNANCDNDTETMSAQGNGNVTDNTPLLLGIDPSVWISGQVTAGVSFTGQYFGSNLPKLTFSPSGGITYSITSYTDSLITANVSVAAGTSAEEVQVSITNNGYSGQGFVSGGGAVSAVSVPVYASVKVPSNSPEITVIAWINSNTSDLTPSLKTLAAKANSNLPKDLANQCAANLFAWSALKIPLDILSDADRNYANTFLIANTGNPDPGPSLTSVETALQAGNYRLFNDYGNNTGKARVGSTPSPCPGFLMYLGASIVGGGEAGPNMGAWGVSNGHSYKLAQGRAGSVGQKGFATINQNQTLPFIWDVIEFDSLGRPLPDANGNATIVDKAMFPTYSVYSNNQRVQVYSQGLALTFLNNNTASNVSSWSPVP